MRKIQYQNKVAIDPDIELPAINKVTDNDMNEIKAVVNANADELKDIQDTTTEYVSDTDTRMNNLESAMTNLEEDVDNFEETIQGDITDIENSISDITSTTYTKTETDTLLNAKANTTALNEEITARQNADVNLQNQIDSIVASSDVVDIVGTYQELLNYDTTHLGDNDIIKVLDDSTHNNATSYFRWKKSTSTWQYIGSEGPYYTKGETDALLNGKVNVVEGKGLSTNDFTDALKTKLDGIESGAQVNKIETIKVNGNSQTITNKSVDISVPTKTSDLTNDSNYVKNKDYANNNTGGVIKTMANYNTECDSQGRLRAITNSYVQYEAIGNNAFIGKGTLENVITGKGLVSNTDYATGSTGGVILPGWYYFNVGNDGRPYADSRTYSDYTSADNKVFISKGTLENVLNAKIGSIDTALDLINGEVV